MAREHRVFYICETECFVHLMILTFDLLLDRLCGVQPVRDVVGIRVLEAEVVLLDQVEVVVDLLHQLLTG